MGLPFADFNNRYNSLVENSLVERRSIEAVLPQEFSAFCWGVRRRGHNENFCEEKIWIRIDRKQHNKVLLIHPSL